MELLAEFLGQVGRHEAVAEPIEDLGLENVDADVEAIVAGTLVPGGGTAEQVLADLDVAGPAAAALGDAGDREAWSLLRPERPVASRIGAGIVASRLRSTPRSSGESSTILAWEGAAVAAPFSAAE
jgi:hypothetical protein